MPEYLFVYGSLRQSSYHPMHGLLVHYTKPVGEAAFQGLLYSLVDYPAAVPSELATDLVKGEVYEVDNAKALFTFLDEYEDFWPDRPNDSLYLRQIHPVRVTETGRVILAWIYIYNRPTESLTRVDSGDWLDVKGKTE